MPRLTLQRQILSRQIGSLLATKGALNIFGDRTLLVAEMFEDSFAASKTPRDLFMGHDGSLIRAPARNGYLIETKIDDLVGVKRRIEIGVSVAHRCDISRVKAVRPYGLIDLLRGREKSLLWNEAPQYEHGRAFFVWFSPFRDPDARNALLETVQQIQQQGDLLPTTPRMLFGSEGESLAVPDLTERQSSLAIAQRDYRLAGRALALVEIPSPSALDALLVSGSVFRIEPVRSLGITSPGGGEDPRALPSFIADQPIVGVVDGGCTATRYRPAVAWRDQSFVGDGIAASRHGNQVASVVIHGHEWNNNLPLPELYCRVGVAQAIARSDAQVRYDPGRLISYIDGVMSRHPDTRVWNLSWNERTAADPIYVSALGHELSLLARKHNALFVISAGNVSGTSGERIAPPADCEAALVVGARQFDSDGNLGDVCPESLCGHGPEYLLVPQVTSYSPLRLLGGVVSRGTSFPTGLISALAAHAFENLRDPTPDMVRALIVNQTELDHYDTGLGWGTPHSEHMPWECAPGAVTLAFRAPLKAGILYYWEDIPIPREMVRSGKLFGRVSLTTVHKPLCNAEGGPSYIASRVGAAVQYPKRNGDFARLVGAEESDRTAEMTARQEEFKWQPFRHDCRDFTKRGGIVFNGSSFRLYARLYARDIVQFGYRVNADIPEVETVFVISFSDGSNTSGLYNTFAASLGNFVESAVVNQEIEIET